VPDFDKIISGIKSIFKLIFGDHTPPWLFPVIGWGLLFIGAICAVWGIMVILSKIKDLWLQSFRPLFYNDEEKRLGVRRRNFAGYIKDEILKLDRHEDWKDFRFADLEAEVEAESYRRILGVLPLFLQAESSSLRTERSLSKAIASSQDRLILVEGDPGSGKSVALRHVALAIAKHAEGTRNIKSIIPIYVNLKELERPENAAIDRNLIESFVLKSLKRTNDRFVEQFLDDEFDKGMENSTWFFLFDSFDELPEVLSSTAADMVVRQYGDAIDDFLHGINRCRGVIASRQFRGPDRFGWPRFRVLPLSEKRRLDLIQKMGLKRETENEFIGQLDIANEEIRSMASNPLLLTLLCEHVKNGHPFPENTYTVFETYITNRLTRDEPRLQRRFQLNAAQLRRTAEQIAFCMAADLGLGLSPTRSQLKDGLRRIHMDIEDDFNSRLDALEYIKLARSDTATDATQSPSFTFAHRRFQEYFATCVVLREPTRISCVELLINARWRETAVVMCQTQPIDQLTTILEEADQILLHYCSTIPDLIDNPVQYLLNDTQRSGARKQKVPNTDFSWSPSVYHLLGLLQDGFSRRLENLPDNLRASIGKIVLSIFEKGMMVEKKWILEVAGLAPEPVLTYVLNRAFASPSQWLKDIAYRQVARLNTIPPEIAQGIRDAIIDLAFSDRLFKERYAAKAHLGRIDRSVDFLAIVKLLLWLPYIDLGMHILCFILFLFLLARGVLLDLRTPLLLFFWLLLSYLVLRPKYIPPLRTDFSLATFIRFYVLFGAAWTLNSVWHHLKLSLLVIILLITIILIVYDYFAFKAAKTGLFVKNRWWAFLSFWPIIYFSVSPHKALQSLRKAISKKVLGETIIVILIMGCLTGLLVGIVTLWTTIIAKYLPLLYIIGIIVFWSVVGVVLGIGIVYLVGKPIYNQMRDWFRWKESHYSSLTSQELFKALSLYHTTGFRLRLVRLVRERHLLIATNEQEVFLLQVLSATETKHHSLSSTSNKENETNETTIECSLIAKRWSSAIFDELYRLLDDLHAFRRGE